MLAAGSKLGHYEILGPLGAGGMGDVYRARDPRLGRDVAIKVLPEPLAASTESCRRFEREARAISALNHPHICVLYDVGHQDGIDYLVMEHLEGETLAHRLERGALPTEQVLRYGMEIADALDRAHRGGIVHRDLKPGNVMLTKTGAKLLDFGLARRMEVLSGDLAGISNVSGPSPRSMTLTGQGVIVGTMPYMAPEQLQGLEADARSDIFSLGATLYEMATGRRAFPAENQASLVASILAEEPPSIAELQPASPPGLEQLIKRCLAKDPDDRWQSARDVMLELRWTRDHPAEAGPAAVAPSQRRRRAQVAWALAIIGVLTALARVVLTRTRPERLPMHAAVTLPPGVELTLATDKPILAVAPDGSRIAFCARSGEGPDMLWVRSLQADDARPIAGTEGAFMPFFSPDGQSLGFFAGRKLKRVDTAGGPVVSLADALEPRGGTWSSRGVILYTPEWKGPVYRVPAAGGTPVPATVLDSTRNETTHRYPSVLPDGRRFLYLARSTLAGPEGSVVYAGRLDSPRRTRVVNAPSNAAYGSGYVLFVRQSAMVAQRVDLGRLAALGPERPLIENVRADERRSYGQFALSQNGILACVTGKSESRKRLRWMNRDGTKGEHVGEAADYSDTGDPTISPDGSRAAVSMLNRDRAVSGIWLLDLTNGRRRRFTIDDDDHLGCAWSSDGSRLAINAMSRAGTLAVMARAASGSAIDETLYVRKETYWQPRAWSPDGRFILGTDEEHVGQAAGTDVTALALEDHRVLVRVAGGPGDQRAPHLAPDGRLVAYVSNESGRDEIYVTSFPRSTSKWQVSSEGGVEPRWSRDGAELFYFDRGNWLIAVEVKASPGGFAAGATRRLFQLHRPGELRRYDVAGNGARFLVSTPLAAESPVPITVMTEWTTKLGR